LEQRPVPRWRQVRFGLLWVVDGLDTGGFGMSTRRTARSYVSPLPGWRTPGEEVSSVLSFGTEAATIVRLVLKSLRSLYRHQAHRCPCISPANVLGTQDALRLAWLDSVTAPRAQYGPRSVPVLDTRDDPPLHCEANLSRSSLKPRGMLTPRLGPSSSGIGSRLDLDKAEPPSCLPIVSPRRHRLVSETDCVQRLLVRSEYC